LPTITPNISFNPQSSPNPLADYFAGLEKIKKLEVNLVLPAHEFAFSNLAERIREIEEHHQRRLTEILDLLAGEPKTAYAIATKVKWDSGPWETLGSWDRRAALMETLAHLEFLRQAGEVTCVTSAEPVVYRRV